MALKIYKATNKKRSLSYAVSKKFLTSLLGRSKRSSESWPIYLYNSDLTVKIYEKKKRFKYVAANNTSFDSASAQSRTFSLTSNSIFCVYNTNGHRSFTEKFHTVVSGSIRGF